MNDYHVADIGDFASYGLVRALCGTPEQPVPCMRLGIIWYRTSIPVDYEPLRGYLEPSAQNDQTYRACDANLYCEIRRLVLRKEAIGERLCVPDILDLDIFPPDTLHYPDSMPDPPRLRDRRDWFAGAVRETAEADVIFLNPDIGMTWNDGWMNAYAYRREMRALFEADKVLVIYQHSQQQAFRDWIARNIRRLGTVRLREGDVRVCRWGRERARAYFIVTRNEHQTKRIDTLLADFQNTPWVTTGNFEVI